MRAALEGALAGALPVHVAVVDAIERDTNGSGKFKLVRSEVGQATATRAVGLPVPARSAVASMFSRT